VSDSKVPALRYGPIGLAQNTPQERTSSDLDLFGHNVSFDSSDNRTNETIGLGAASNWLQEQIHPWGWPQRPTANGLYDPWSTLRSQHQAAIGNRAELTNDDSLPQDAMRLAHYRPTMPVLKLDFPPQTVMTAIENQSQPSTNTGLNLSVTSSKRAAMSATDSAGQATCAVCHQTYGDISVIQGKRRKVNVDVTVDYPKATVIHWSCYKLLSARDELDPTSVSYVCHGHEDCPESYHEFDTLPKRSTIFYDLLRCTKTLKSTRALPAANNKARLVEQTLDKQVQEPIEMYLDPQTHLLVNTTRISSTIVKPVLISTAHKWYASLTRYTVTSSIQLRLANSNAKRKRDVAQVTVTCICGVTIAGVWTNRKLMSSTNLLEGFIHFHCLHTEKLTNVEREYDNLVCSEGCSAVHMFSGKCYQNVLHALRCSNASRQSRSLGSTTC
jgi:hypothetical protein